MLFILHADHEQNCSTNAVRAVGSSQVDPYSAVAAGVAALYGPLHGGANEAVLRMLRRIETTDNIPDFLEGVKNREEKLMGFGHRVYKNYDPRARIIKKHVDEVLEATGDNPLLDIATELEKRALDDEFFTERKLYPNVDFYSGLIYEALRIPTDMFTVIFAIPRTSGWVAQWLEMIDDPEQKIARPRQIYTGERERDYVPIERARGPREDHRPAGAAARSARGAAPEGALAPHVRHGSLVDRERFDDLDEALAELERRAEQIRGEGALAEVSGFATTARERVAARLEISAGGLLRRAEAGIDVMGDGTLVAYSGGIGAPRARAAPREQPVDALARRSAVSGERRDRREGSVEAGRRVRLPRRRGAADQGLHQRRASRAEGADYPSAARDRLHAADRQGEVSGGRWLAMCLGLFGSYGKNEAVDVEFRLRRQRSKLARTSRSSPTRRRRGPWPAYLCLGRLVTFQWRWQERVGLPAGRSRALRDVLAAL